jgi:RimJ/RimL family protein N-acetyltransferase
MRSAVTTARLRLTAFVLDDTSELHEMFSDPVTNTIGSGPFTSVAQTEQWIRHRLDAQAEHGLCWYALRDPGTNRLLGNCGMLRGRTGYDEPEIGYLIDHRSRGLGYATEAATAVLDECRSAGIGRVWATIRPHNAPSRRIADRLGMRMDRDERGDLLFYVVDLGQSRI